MCKSSKDLIFIQLQSNNVSSKSPVLRCRSKVRVPLAPFSFLSYLSPLNKKHTSTNVCRKGRFFWALFCPGVLSVDYDFFLAYQDVNWQSLHLLKGVILGCASPLYGLWQSPVFWHGSLGIKSSSKRRLKAKIQKSWDVSQGSPPILGKKPIDHRVPNFRTHLCGRQLTFFLGPWMLSCFQLPRHRCPWSPKPKLRWRPSHWNHLSSVLSQKLGMRMNQFLSWRSLHFGTPKA